MNHIYRLVWSSLTQAWIAVAENARAHGKATRAGKAIASALLVLSGVMLIAPSSYAANAADATVTLGNGSVSTIGNTTTIKQNSQNLAIDWVGLSTTANEALIFQQPNSSAIALNRITGSSPSTLLGSLTANGQVFILNPNGVLFGAGSQVNVGGLVASTLGMSNADLEAGRMVFALEGNANGSVVNKGTINAGDGGYIALIAGTVRNEGDINARLGTALLAAGDKVTLNINNGSLLGYSIDQGALNALAENKQLIQANGGQVLMSAKALNKLTTAVVNNTGLIEAKTLENRNGRIMLMGDMEVGTVNVGGKLDASAPVTGDGGFVETSAAHVKVAADTLVTTKSNYGKTGTWLIDPNNFTIAASGGDMTGAAVSAALANTNFEIQTATMGTAGGNGDIHVNDAVTWNASTTLTLNAERNININQSITAQDSNGKLALLYGQGAAQAGNTANYYVNAPVNLQAGNNFSTMLGSDGSTVQYTVITSLGAEGSTNTTDLQGIRGNLNGNYVLGADIDASATAGWESGAGFKPIGTAFDGGTSDMTISGPDMFTGVFDGLGHKVQNLNINRPAESYVGLFGVTSGTLKNVGVVGGSIVGNWRVGALTGGLIGTVSNTYASSAVRGVGLVGGLVGFGDTGQVILNSHTTGSAGERAGEKGWYMGGLVGYSAGLISDSYSLAAVTGTRYVGGLVGSTDAVTVIRNSYANNTIGGSTANNPIAYLGGLTGFNQGLIESSFSTSEITIRGQFAGGLAGGNTGTISNSYAAARITRVYGNSGGLVGTNNTDSTGAVGTIINSYASTIIGATLDPTTTGGLVGVNNGNVSNSYWNLATNSSSAGGTGLSSTQLMQASSFTGWDLASAGGSSSAWRIYEGATMPMLRSFMTGLSITGNNVSKTYDGSTTVGNGSYSLSDNNINQSLLLGTVAYGNTSSKNVGVYDLAVSGLYSSQFGYDISFVNGSVTIGKANLTVTAQQSSKTYDGTVNASGSGVAGALAGAGDSFNSSGSLAFLDKNAGNNKTVRASGVTIKDTNGDDMTGNYNITYVDDTNSSISRADLNLTITGVNKVYDGLDAAALSYGDDRIANDTLTFSATSNFNNKNAANGKNIVVSNLVVAGADADNYNVIADTSNITADITPAALTVTVNSYAKNFDGIAYAGNNGSVISGFVNGETVADLSGVLSYGGTAQGATNAGNYAITASGLASNNYTVTFVNGVLAIQGGAAPATQTVDTALSPAYRSALLNSGNELKQQQDDPLQLASVFLPDAKENTANMSQPTPRLNISACGMNLPQVASNGGC